MSIFTRTFDGTCDRCKNGFEPTETITLSEEGILCSACKREENLKRLLKTKEAN